MTTQKKPTHPEAAPEQRDEGTSVRKRDGGVPASGEQGGGSLTQRSVTQWDIPLKNESSSFPSPGFPAPSLPPVSAPADSSQREVAPGRRPLGSPSDAPLSGLERGRRLSEQVQAAQRILERLPPNDRRRRLLHAAIVRRDEILLEGFLRELEG